MLYQAHGIGLEAICDFDLLFFLSMIMECNLSVTSIGIFAGSKKAMT